MKKYLRRIFELIQQLTQILFIIKWRLTYGEKILIGILRTDVFGHLVLHGNRLAVYSKMTDYFEEYKKVILLTDRKITNRFVLNYIINNLPNKFILKYSRWPFKIYKRFYFENLYIHQPFISRYILNFEENLFTIPENRDKNKKFNRINEVKDYQPIKNINLSSLQNYSNNSKIDQSLKKFNLPDNDKIVLIVDRDSAYYGGETATRDTEINVLTEICEYLLSLNYTVIRIGDKRKQRIPIYVDRLIDYSFCQLKSEEIQFALSMRADLVFAWTTGLYHLPQIQNKKISIIDLTSIPSFSPDISFNPRKFFSFNNQPMTICDLIKDFPGDPYDSYELQKSYGIKYIPLNINVAKNVIDQTLGLTIMSKRDHELEKLFLKELSNSLFERSKKINRNLNPKVTSAEINLLSNVVSIDFLRHYEKVLRFRSTI